MSAFSLGGKTKIVFSKTGLFILIVLISLAIFGACSKNAGSDENDTTTAKATSTGLAFVEAGVPGWFLA